MPSLRRICTPFQKGQNDQRIVIPMGRLVQGRPGRSFLAGFRVRTRPGSEEVHHHGGRAMSGGQMKCRQAVHAPRGSATAGSKKLGNRRVGEPAGQRLRRSILLPPVLLEAITIPLGVGPVRDAVAVVLRGSRGYVVEDLQRRTSRPRTSVSGVPNTNCRTNRKTVSPMHNVKTVRLYVNIRHSQIHEIGR